MVKRFASIHSLNFIRINDEGQNFGLQNITSIIYSFEMLRSDAQAHGYFIYVDLFFRENMRQSQSPLPLAFLFLQFQNMYFNGDWSLKMINHSNE